MAFLAHFPSELFLLFSDHLDVFIFFVFAARSEGFVEAELVLQRLIMTAHDIVHLADILRSFLLLSDSVFLELFDELGLVILVDVRDLLCGQLIFGFALDSPEDDLVCIGEPNRIIIVFQELTLHAQNLNIVQL